MWDFSAAARAALAGDHTAAIRVEVWQAGTAVYALEVLSGSVSVDADRTVRRNLACRLVDPTGQLSRGDVDDLLNPYDCEIAPFRGVLLPGGEELAAQGVFGLTSRSVSDGPDGLVIDLAGQDRAMGYQGPMASALAVPGGTPVEVAIRRLLASRNPGVTLQSLDTGFTCGPLLYPPDIDVWAQAQQLAVSVGARVFHDRTGQAVLAGTGPASGVPAASFAEGDGRLLTVNRTEDSDTIRNVVIAESTNGLIRAVVEDSDPTSPTYAGGRYGRRPVTLVSQHFGSVEQAQQAAAARLAYELGRSETVTFTAVPDPALDVEELVTVHRLRVGLDHRGLLTSSIQLPLAADEAMRVGCRRSVLASDGRSFDVEEFTA